MVLGVVRRLACACALLLGLAGCGPASSGATTVHDGSTPMPDAGPASGSEDAHVKQDPDGGVDGQVPFTPSPGRLFLELPDALRPLPHGSVLHERLCTRDLDDPIIDLFCQDSPPAITDLTQLLESLGIRPEARSAIQGFAMTGHSTALSKRFVSAINPRVIYVRLEDGDTLPLSVAFTRGEPFVEAVTLDRETRTLQFYLIAFKLACEETAAGCGPADLLTSATERDWLGIEVFHEDELDNTTLDCKACHQPDGPGTRKLPRMQELENSWTHWFSTVSGGGRALTDDFMAAHDGESFAGLPAELLTASRPSHLAEFVRAFGPFRQPNMFVSSLIEIEVETSSPNQPEDNSVPGQSATWQSRYQVAQRGGAIPMPYHDVKVTAATKLAAMTAAYRSYRDGELSAEALPDIRDVFLDEPRLQTEMGFLVDESLEGQALLTAACATCHNSRLDQSLGRARFHSDLKTLSREQRSEAVRRLQLPATDGGAMPPRRIHDLSAASRQRLIDLLSQ